MSITTTVSSGYRVFKSAEQFKQDCGGSCVYSSTNGSAWFDKTVTVKNSPQHRVKPQNLINDQTGLAKQSTTVTHMGLRSLERSNGSCPFSCTGVSGKKYRYITRAAVTAGTLQASAFPDPDWVTPLRLRIRDLQVNLGESIAEYRKTASMFEGFAKASVKAFHYYRSVKGRKWINSKYLTPCSIPAAHLAGTYGVRPLANDLFDTFMELQDRMKRPMHRRITLLVKEKFEETITTGSFRYHVKGELSRRPIFYVELEPEHYGFTLGDPRALAWELIPFSLVVDMVLPIGDYLLAIDAVKGITVNAGTVTEKVKYYHTLEEPGALATGYMYEDKPYMRYDSHVRTLYGTIPQPPLPKWNPSKSWHQIANGVALLTQLNKRCK